MAPSAFYPRDHFAQRADERGFTLAQAESCVRSPEKKRRQGRGEEGGFKEVFQKALGDHKLFVLAEIKGADCWLITGYWQ